MERSPLTFTLKDFNEASLDSYDTVVIVAQNIHKNEFKSKISSKYYQSLEDYKQYDDSVENDGCLLVVPDTTVKRMVYSPVGTVDRDFDDVRRFRDAAFNGVKRALQAGAKKLVLLIPDSGNSKFKAYDQYDLITVLGALEAVYVPLEIRENVPSKSRKVDILSFHNFHDEKRRSSILNTAQALEAGRAVARDIGGSDPERMSAPNVQDYVINTFKGSSIKVDVIKDKQTIEKEFPCLGAVNRGSNEKHEGRVIFLTYEPEGAIKSTIILVGKGVTYDTGGHDVKAGGHMAGMHRDKCGAAAVAGFFKVVDALKPEGVKVLGAMAMVRNSIGPNAYVADELITARSGVRIRVGNTDAEGRMAMVDVLCYMKEKALKEKLVNPHLFTIATLTGHACLAVGENYSCIMENGPAKKQNIARSIQDAGNDVNDFFEISTIRKEDYDAVKGKSEYEDILQCNNLPSSQTPRGHQLPGAFLIRVSGLDKHGGDSEKPLCFAHIDIAASSGPFPGIPTGAPILALARKYLLQ